MTSLAERVIEAREAAGFDKADLSRAVAPVRMTHSALSQIEAGKTKTLKAETALALARATGFRTEYIVFGQLPKRAADQPPGSAGDAATVAGMMQPANRGMLAMAIESLESALAAAGAVTTAAGKAEMLGIVFELLRVGAATKTVEKEMARVVQAIGLRGIDPKGGTDGGSNGEHRGTIADET